MLSFLARSMGLLETVIVIVLGISVAGAGILVYHLMVQNGRVLLRLEALERQLRDQDLLPPEGHALPPGLPPGTVLNDFSLPSLSGETVTLSQWRGRPVLLIFFHPGCSFCGRFLTELTAFMKTVPELPAVPLFISRGGEEENRRLFEQHATTFPVLLQEEAEVSTFFKIPGTPVGYLVTENGATASEMLVGAESLLRALGALATPVPATTGEQGGDRKFTRSLAESRLVRDGLKTGTVAPDFTLPTLDGAELSLKDYRGQKVLLVFSDPECQPCNRVARELERIHRRSNGLQVLMVSRGERLANGRKVAEHGLTFPIALQQHWEISKAYGMFATPIAYLIDEKGFLISDVAVGAEPILRLAS